MSIHPVPTLGPGGGAPADSAVVRKGSSIPTQADVAHFESGTKPTAEHPPSKAAPESAEMPRDEVQVQRVNGASGDIVIRYLDASGNLILQIPSSQVLGLARAVEQALEDQASRRTGDASQEALPGQGEAFDGR